MTKNWLIALVLCFAGIAQAQESNLSVTLGVRAWNAQWDTFSYQDTGGGNFVITQTPADEKFVLVPLLSVRYGAFVGHLSMYPSTDHHFINAGGSGTRKELDVNVGYFVAPGVVATLGYKRIERSDSGNRFSLNGPVAGVSLTASLGGDFALYGNVVLGRLKTRSGDLIQFDVDYRLSEVGVAYAVTPPSIAKALTFTVGYRSQVLSAKDAVQGQDGRDLTQGLTLGVLATF